MFDPDAAFFNEHKDRQCHIRTARSGELSAEFAKLGPHNLHRRRILAWKIPKDNPFYPRILIMKVPFLKFSDETLEDTDEILLPILKEIMVDAKKGQEG